MLLKRRKKFFFFVCSYVLIVSGYVGKGINHCLKKKKNKKERDFFGEKNPKTLVLFWDAFGVERGFVGAFFLFRFFFFFCDSEECQCMTLQRGGLLSLSKRFLFLPIFFFRLLFIMIFLLLFLLC